MRQFGHRFTDPSPSRSASWPEMPPSSSIARVQPSDVMNAAISGTVGPQGNVSAAPPIAEKRVSTTTTDPSPLRISRVPGFAPGELVLTDPSGDRTGPMTKDIHLSNPMSGFYNLRVIGRRTGTYLLILKAYTASGSTSDVRFPHMTTKAGEVHHYDVNFSAEGPKLDVRRTRITTE